MVVPERARGPARTQPDGDTLKGPGKIAISPLVRARHDAKENWMFIHVGRALCGHEGVIHGGLLATLLDESLARVVSVLFLGCSFGRGLGGAHIVMLSPPDILHVDLYACTLFFLCSRDFLPLRN